MAGCNGGVTWNPTIARRMLVMPIRQGWTRGG